MAYPKFRIMTADNNIVRRYSLRNILRKLGGLLPVAANQVVEQVQLSLVREGKSRSVRSTRALHVPR